MIKLFKLNSFLTELMHYDDKVDVSKIDKNNANGLQVKGVEKIGKIAFGVSASKRLFELAKEKGCQAVVTHHGIRFPDSPHFQKDFQERYEFLIKNGISLFGYHFLMDSHPEIGHNALILKKLGAVEELEGYGMDGVNWGQQGKLKRTMKVDLVVKRCEKLFKQDVQFHHFGKPEVKKIAAVSGSGSPYGQYLQNVINRKIDLFITGEEKEGSREAARDAGINILFGGHYATERLGVLELETKVQEHFNNEVETEFIELWNKV